MRLWTMSKPRPLLIERRRPSASRALPQSRQLRLTQGEWVMLGSIWTADSSNAWQVWCHPGNGDGRLWPYIVTKDGVIPQKFEP